MSTISDGEQPKVIFDQQEKSKLAGIARCRQKAVIEYLTNPPLVTEDDARAQNRLGNHLVGEVTEQVVSLWLSREHVNHSRAASVVDELRDGVPDIATKPHDVVIDVKGSVFGNSCRFCARKVKDDPKLAVVWCLPLRFGDYDYDSDVPDGAKIIGWSTMIEVKAAENVEGWHQLFTYELHPLSLLLEWINTGTAPY